MQACVLTVRKGGQLQPRFPGVQFSLMRAGQYSFTDLFIHSTDFDEILFAGHFPRQLRKQQAPRLMGELTFWEGASGHK